MEPTSDTNASRLYEVEEFSDVQLIMPGSGTIHAHKAILASGSGHFRSKFQLPIYTLSSHGGLRNVLRLLTVLQEGIVATLEIMDFDPALVYIAIKYLYGFDLMANGKPERLNSLDDWLELCTVAVQWDIEGLLDSVLKAADSVLTYYLDVEDEENVDYLLMRFFGGRLVVQDDDKYPQHLLGIIGPHLIKLYTKPRFQYVLDNSPNMVRHLLDALVKDKAFRESLGM